MGIFDWLKPKRPVLGELRKVEKEEEEEKYKLTVEDRKLSLEKRRANRALKQREAELEYQQKMLELDDLEEEIAAAKSERGANTDGDALTVLVSALVPYIPAIMEKLTGKQLSSQTLTPQMPDDTTQDPNLGKIDLSDDEVEALYKENKKYAKLARGMSDDNLKAMILQYAPNLSEASLDKIVLRVKK